MNQECNDILIIGIDQSSRCNGIGCLYYNRKCDNVYLVLPRGDEENELSLMSFTVRSGGITKEFPRPFLCFEEFMFKANILLELIKIKLETMASFNLNSLDIYGVIESVYLGRNPKSALSLARMQTFTAIYLSQLKLFGPDKTINVVEVNSNSAKSSIGVSKKESVSGSINNLFGTNFPSETGGASKRKHESFGHITDAIALSYCLFLKLTKKTMCKGKIF